MTNPREVMAAERDMNFQVDEDRLNSVRHACRHLNEDIVPAVIDAAYAEIQRLESENERLQRDRESIVELQRTQLASHRQEQVKTFERHREDKRQLVEDCGFAGIIHDRVIGAERAGRKTVRVADLLEGKPDDD